MKALGKEPWYLPVIADSKYMEPSIVRQEKE